jgi:Arc/MetJ-type ribon-helix-helix transcriptional regulator
MEINLNPEDRLLLDKLMTSGVFQSEEELIHRSLEALQQHEEWKLDLNKKIAEGLADIERDDLIEDVAIEELLNSYVRKSA